MIPKFSMTREENVFVAKRNIIDYIWKSAKLEGLGVTYPDTEAIFNGRMAPNVKVEEIVAVNNLKHAWQFLLDNLDAHADYSYICHLNKIVGGDNLVINAGYIRNIPVSIGGTSWKPDMPIESQIKKDINEIFTIAEPTERAIVLMMYLMRKQMFIDGNKRTSMLAGNQIMIANGCGIISVPLEHQHQFTTLLVQYYESADMEIIKQFVYDNCIDGMDFELARKKINNTTDETISESDSDQYESEGFSQSM
ncbi:MAG TPA: cell filamentation protein Fic [Ruminococcaceae bacterium]|nr:cell filamentation protein Fic [Oscillospiraceae bacterium]